MLNAYNSIYAHHRVTSEAGHAFMAYMAMKEIDNEEILWPGYEACEIHSMSMEFLAYPWMYDFFLEDEEKYKQYHLSDAITFLPYGVLVDHFQHFVYENPDITVEERNQKWRELEKMYLPYKKYADLPGLESGMWWYRQSHIFGAPFYYIDYTLAQICAFEFYLLSLEDRTKAWDKYLKLCKLGGSMSFLDLLKTVDLRNPFTDGVVSDICQRLVKIIKG